MSRAGTDALQAWLTRCLIVGLVAGIFALSHPHLLLASLAASVASFLCMSCVRPVSRLGIVVLANYGYWLVSGVVSGGLGWASVTSSEFWRGEGRCFFFYIPLLVMAVLRIGQDQLRFVLRTVCTLTLIGAMLCGLWLVGFGDLFQAEVDPETGERSTSIYFIGLLTSHTGAGAFWATVAAFLLAFSLRTGEKRLQLLALLAVLLTLSTGGRAATLGLIAAGVWLLGQGDLLNRRTMKWLVPAALPLAAGLWAVAALVPDIAERMLEMFSARTMSSLVDIARARTLKDASADFFSGANLEHHNLVIRVFLWKYALHLFSQSPLLGIGFCRFNDTHLEFGGIPHVANLAVGGERYFGSGIRWEQQQFMTSTGNAHNSYFHMLAETGIIGLALLMYLWYLMFRECRPARQGEDRGIFEQAYCQGCRAAIICLLGTALPGHALGAPSGGILLTTVVGVAVAYRRGQGCMRLPNVFGTRGSGRVQFASLRKEATDVFWPEHDSNDGQPTRPRRSRPGDSSTRGDIHLPRNSDTKA